MKSLSQNANQLQYFLHEESYVFIYILVQASYEWYSGPSILGLDL